MHEKATVFDEYLEWTGYQVRRGVLNTQKYKGMSAAACVILNYSTWIILTPWFLAHRIAYHNHNETPNTIGNKLKYILAFIVAMIYDIPCVVIGGGLLYTMITSAFTSINALGGIGLLIASLFVSYPFLKTGLCRLPDLFEREKKLNVTTEEETDYYYEEQEEVEQEEVEQEEEIVEELPFCQIFRLNETEDLHIVRVEYCPDETAFIRVVSEESYTKEYKRKVQIDEAGNRFIEFNDKKYYLKCSGDDEVIDIDKMDGATFEHFCADLLRVNGWTDVQITPASGDHGIDITAEKDDIKWGFQCKRWNGTKVDAVAIGQTYKGKALYECDIVAIITTSSFTRQAEDEARQLGIKLWRRAKIRQLMSKLENAEDYYLSA